MLSVTPRDLHDIPKDITNAKVTVYLGYLRPGSENEHLDSMLFD